MKISQGWAEIMERDPEINKLLSEEMARSFNPTGFSDNQAIQTEAKAFSWAMYKGGSWRTLIDLWAKHGSIVSAAGAMRLRAAVQQYAINRARAGKSNAGKRD